MIIDAIEKSLEKQLPELKFSRKKWSQISTIGIGKGKLVLTEPSNDLQLKEVLKLSRNMKMKILVLGNGSNIIGSDNNFDGIVIKLSQNDFVRIKKGRKHLTAGAGVSMLKLAEFAAENGFRRLGELSGIPGTLGGAVRLNAAANGVSIGDFVVDIFGLDENAQAWTSSNLSIDWEYRKVSIPDQIVFIGVILSLPKGKPDEEKALIENELLKRRRFQTKYRSAGCFFKNPSENFSAGALIDRCGFKNMSVGDAVVSKKHANYLCNKNNASEEELISLASELRSQIAFKSGIFLNPEVKIINSDSQRKLLKTPETPKIAVLKGGVSSEREVSLDSGKAVAQALENAGWCVEEIDLPEEKIPGTLESFDLVFPLLHGGWGENGGLQKELEMHKIPFVGSDSKSCRILFDKIESKKLMKKNGIPTPEYLVITEKNMQKAESFPLPCVVKPACEGSTVGLSIVKKKDDIQKALNTAFEFGKSVLIEEYIDGIETTVSIIDGKTMPMIEIRFPGENYDYDAKYTHANGETVYLCPPESVAENIQKIAAETALDFYKLSGAQDLLRVDMIIRQNGEISVLEANNIPGFTSSSLVPKSAEASGISFVELCAELALINWKKNK